LLKDHRHVSFSRRQSANIAAVEKYPAARWYVEPGDQSQRGRLASARWPHEHKQFIFSDIQAEVVHGADRAGKSFAEMRKRDGGHELILAAIEPRFNLLFRHRRRQPTIDA
jgi:hypothetical protein